MAPTVAIPICNYEAISEALMFRSGNAWEIHAAPLGGGNLETDE
jgi:hypothetical protein